MYKQLKHQDIKRAVNLINWKTFVFLNRKIKL